MVPDGEGVVAVLGSSQVLGRSNQSAGGACGSFRVRYRGDLASWGRGVHIMTAIGDRSIRGMGRGAAHLFQGVHELDIRDARSHVGLDVRLSIDQQNLQKQQSTRIS